MTNANTQTTDLTRRQLFRKAGAAALTGMALGSGLPMTSALAHEDEEPDMEILLGEFYCQVVGQERGMPVHITAGQRHQIQITNEGKITHEVHFGREWDQEAKLYKENLFGPGGDQTMQGFLGVHLRPGESVVLHIWVPVERRGEWELGCFMPGHYSTGQKAPVHIE